MSRVRTVYMLRFIYRCVIFVLCALLCIFIPEEFNVLKGANFFNEFSVLHILWVVWVLEMLSQFFPTKTAISIGSQKIFRDKFKPIREKINRDGLKKYIRTVSKAAYRVMILWCLLLAVLGALYFSGVINEMTLFMISAAFYVCDLICVLFWCPFRLLMKTRCCTTCRIFNWDHFMMFSPLMFIGGFYTLSLFLLSVANFAAWEVGVLIHPERFWENSNEALRCSECTDKLCTQYCQKLRK